MPSNNLTAIDLQAIELRIVARNPYLQAYLLGRVDRKLLFRLVYGGP